jgi:hypothetical protein
MNCSCPTTTPVGFSCLFNLAAFIANVDGNFDTVKNALKPPYDSNEFFSEFDFPESCLDKNSNRDLRYMLLISINGNILF